MKDKFLKLSCLLITFIFSIGIVNASSFSVSVGSKNLTKGGSTKLTIKGVDATGRFNIKSSNAGVVSVSESAVWIENNSYTINLSALNVGTSTITVTAADVSDNSGNSVSLGSKTIKISVSLPREKSTDNNLKSLSIEGYEITPTFSKDVTNYSVTVKEGTKEIKINATPNSGYAKVSGTGTVNLIEGINNLSIVVKAESGAEKVYKLVVNVIDENPINVTIEGKNYTVVKLKEQVSCPTNFEASEQVIENVPVPSCTNTKINYILIGLKDEEGNTNLFTFNNNKYERYLELQSKELKIINKTYDKEVRGYEKTKIEIDGITYDGFKNNKNERLILVYGVNVETGEEGLYQYDTKNKTFSIYFEDVLESLDNTNQKYLYVIIIFGIAIFLSIICILILTNKNKKLMKKLKINKDMPKEENILEEQKEDNNQENNKKNKSREKKKNVE